MTGWGGIYDLASGQLAGRGEFCGPFKHVKALFAFLRAAVAAPPVLE